METVFLLCALVGGSILVLQTVLSFIGIGGDGLDLDGDFDFEADIETGDGFEFAKFLSVRAMIAFVAFFGLAGKASLAYGLALEQTLLYASLAGLSAFVIVGYLMHLMTKLNNSGNINIHNAIGQPARVYLRIPGHEDGHGKVTVEVQGRRIECRAQTTGPELPTGVMVTVVGVASPNTLQVLKDVPQA